MNKPAPKEPSMDEILSSIRQIIADDDAVGGPRRAAIQAADDPMQAAPARPADRDLNDMLDDIEPLALNASQIVDSSDDDDIDGFSFDSILADTPVDEEPAVATPPLVDPEDISFAPAPAEQDDDLPSFDPPVQRSIIPDPKPAPAAAKPAPVAAPQPKPEPEPELADDDVDLPKFDVEAELDVPAFNPQPMAEVEAVSARAPEVEPEVASFTPPPQPSVAQAAPMPDPSLSSDMASQLLGATTQAAVRSSMTKLNGLGLGNAGATIESLMRDMLRPMLKEWLDENLPAVVERMVEKEIARVSRGE
tara:strand:+ start:33323 stop:34240 length:918 start_codon:yes stop_codon:yes gene_type:complete